MYTREIPIQKKEKEQENRENYNYESGDRQPPSSTEHSNVL